jgi:S1-C subfamily serine protease
VIVLDSGKSYKASVVGYTVNHDIAVLQLKSASGLAVAPLGDSSTIRSGDAVTTMGNAGGAGGAPSVGTGTVVGLGKSITARDDSGDSEKLSGLIETNAPLQPGDSGGPMVDASGNVVGIDTAASTSFTYQGSGTQGFAIPINTALSLVSQIVAGQASASIHIGPTAFLGVQVSESSPYYMEGSPAKGLFVGRVVTGGPIDKAGVQVGDIVTKFNGTALTSQDKLTTLVLAKAPGDTVQLRWVDQYGQAHSAALKLAVGPPQ